MKVLVVLSVLVAFAAAADLSPAELSMLEAFDYETLLANKELSQKLFDCMLEKGECGEYKQVAELSMKTLQSKCAECTPAQKAKYETVVKQLKEKYEPVYNELLKKSASTQN